MFWKFLGRRMWEMPSMPAYSLVSELYGGNRQYANPAKNVKATKKYADNRQKKGKKK